jgi:uncharacterized protein YbjT (DUF2867 family)
MDWMIYGANGYTGELIAREAKKRGAVPVLAGRDAAKTAELARDRAFPRRCSLSTRLPMLRRRLPALVSF